MGHPQVGLQAVRKKVSIVAMNSSRRLGLATMSCGMIDPFPTIVVVTMSWWLGSHPRM